MARVKERNHRVFLSLPAPGLGNYQLFQAHFSSTYTDSDGLNHVDERTFVLADSYESAIRRTDAWAQKLRKRYPGGPPVVVRPLPLESLVPARDRSQDKLPPNTFSLCDIESIGLSDDDRHEGYRLAVCLVREER